MQRKKFLALMLTAALVGQPGAPVSIMAAETDESSDFGSFGSEASDTAEKKLPVITEDLSEETITYDLNEKAEPLKVQTEESGKLKYLWLKSDDNENFYKIEKSDSQEKTKRRTDRGTDHAGRPQRPPGAAPAKDELSFSRAAQDKGERPYHRCNNGYR